MSFLFFYHNQRVVSRFVRDFLYALKDTLIFHAAVFHHNPGYALPFKCFLYRGHLGTGLHKHLGSGKL